MGIKGNPLRTNIYDFGGFTKSVSWVFALFTV